MLLRLTSSAAARILFRASRRHSAAQTARLLADNTYYLTPALIPHRHLSTSRFLRKENSNKDQTGFPDSGSAQKDKSTEQSATTSPEVGKLASELLHPVQEAKEQVSLEVVKEENVGDDDTPETDFLTTIFDKMEPYIDTYEAYKQLVRAGFTPAQSDEIINMIIVQLNSKLSKLSTKYSQAYELENEQYLFESAQQELRVDITRNREIHINESINQINVLERDYGIISDDLNNHFLQMKNDIQVAINDQKSENTLMSKKIMLRIQETNHKITTELNMAMRSEIESLRWHLSRWGLIAILVLVFSTCASYYVYKKQNETKHSKNEFVPLVIYEPSEFDEDDYHADLDPNDL